ncbi:type II CRISPR RNA-guided endonuclease Cas9 [bacterium]|nr:type II CRISPR RNA-guided endonuclease Cas9 [bacterium]MBP3819185.1 type II CRISPR RNA-guided endonuclease Cas9 [Butyrivibrio sp.]
MGDNDKKSKYYVGLDMGTESVGWAVTDSNYVIKRAKGKDMWGSRLFPAANTAADRRKYRIGRRRRQREVARINYLKMCFSKAIDEVDSGFIQRLDESKYLYEDRTEENKQKYSLFNDKNFNDKDYYQKYPTIFHLRSELLKNDPIEKHDVRLVYLALLNMFKHRGNFLIDTLDIESDGASVSDAYKSMVETANLFDFSFPATIDLNELQNTLSDRSLSKKSKLEKLAEITDITKKNQPAEYEILQICCGMKGKLATIFGDVISEDEKTFSISFADSSFDEDSGKALEMLGEEYYQIIDAAKEIYDAGLLANIMKGEKYISDARVSDYKSHGEDLVLLKKILKKYSKDDYDEFFRKMGEGNYSAYVGSVNSDIEKKRRNGNKGRSQEELYKTIQTIIKKLPKDAQEDEEVKFILTKIDAGSFLPKQLTGSNGVIPNQVYAREMKQILANASTYLPFLTEKDESGLTTSERILQIFTYHIPYFVGPLGGKGENVWAKRIESGPIYPWNIEKKIDISKAAENFITRMLRSCSYMQNQRVLPKQSLLYEKFMVLNELNNLRLYGDKVSVDVKQAIYNDLFMKGKKVTRKKLVNYLVASGVVSKSDSADEIISGIDGDFKNYLSSVNKFEAIFGNENIYTSKRDMIEKIIFWGTVFGKDKKIIKEKIKKEYGSQLNDDQIKRIAGFNFTGWGNLSKELLEMPGKEGTDEAEKSIIICLWETNENLMELLSSSHTFKKELEERTTQKQKELSEWTIEDLDGMYLSPSVKRMVWQTLKILKEINQVIGNAPEKIFVEMPREDGEKGKRTESRKKKLESLYKGQKQFLQEIGKLDERELRQKKLYLYYLQNGKSMYTGNEIDLEELLSNNSKYDIDHIYPRHYIKDDSLDNNLVLVEKEINNDIKGGDYPISTEIQSRMRSFWKGLKEKGFITAEKYDRLVRTTEFTEQEQADFIARQLVETRQGTKAITQILKSAFPDTKIVFSKASVVSEFRHKYDIPKVRCLNSCHHAHDAYLNIVVGNTYYVKFTANPLNFIKEAGKNWRDPFYKYHMDKIFNYKVERNGEVAWIPQNDDNPGTIQIVKKMLSKATVLLTAKSYMVHGGISNKATVWSAEDAKKNPNAYYPVKTSDTKMADVKKYGGITSIANAGYALVQYTILGKSVNQNKTVRALIGIPIYLFSQGKLLDSYLQNKVKNDNNKKEIIDFSIIKFPIKFNTLAIINGHRCLIKGATGDDIALGSFCQLYLCKNNTGYLGKISKAFKNADYNELKNGEKIITSSKNIDLYSELSEKLSNTTFKTRGNNIDEVIKNGRAIFAELSIENQCYVIMQIVNWMNSVNQTIDLRLIGGSKNAGYFRIGKIISNCHSAYLIYTSATGLHERKVDLLR